MEQKKIDRINELARKAKTPEGLTAEEKEEQKKLRTEYIAVIRMNLRAQLDNIDIQEKDGSITNLGDKYGLKKRKLERISFRKERNLPRNRRRPSARVFIKRSYSFPPFVRPPVSTLMWITIRKPSQERLSGMPGSRING